MNRLATLQSRARPSFLFGLIIACFMAFGTSVCLADDWIETNAPPQTGSIDALAISPTNSNLWWLATSDEGGQAIYRTDDAGGQWHRLGSGLPPSCGLHNLKLHPDGEHVASIGCPVPHLFLSSDDTRTWHNILVHADLADFFLAPSDPDVIYVTTREYDAGFTGIWRTGDGGATWRRADGGLESPHGLLPIHAQLLPGRCRRSQSAAHAILGWVSLGSAGGVPRSG